MQNKLFVVSDTHFGGTDPDTSAYIPYITKWNSIVSPNDFVIHLGDIVAGRNNHAVLPILNKLHGRKILVMGNHDHELSRRDPSLFSPYFESVHEVATYCEGRPDVIFSHRPLRNHDEQNLPKDIMLNVHGHFHQHGPTTSVKLRAYRKEYTPHWDHFCVYNYPTRMSRIMHTMRRFRKHPYMRYRILGKRDREFLSFSNRRTF
jgi:calcineurin-like phosphoesterase family protein